MATESGEPWLWFSSNILRCPGAGLGTRCSFPGERAAAAGWGTGESPHVPAVPLRRQLSWVDLSWFLMKAASACQLSLGVEGEEVLCAGNGLESVAARVSMAWGRPVWELRVSRPSLLITGFPGWQCPEWCHSCPFLTRLPWSLGGSLWPVPSAEHSGWETGFLAWKPKPPVVGGAAPSSPGGALGRGLGSQVGGRQVVVTWVDGCAPSRAHL